jgi:hypothetical protein
MSTPYGFSNRTFPATSLLFRQSHLIIHRALSRPIRFQARHPNRLRRPRPYLYRRLLSHRPARRR